MLKRYLPDALTVRPPERATGWTSQRYDAATALILSLRHCHDGELPQRLPHQAMIDATGEMLRESDLAQSLASGWTLARDVALASGVAAPITPMTRIAPPIRVFRKPRERASPDARSVRHPQIDTAVPLLITRRSEPPRPSPQRKVAAPAVLAAAFTVVLGAAVAHQVFPEAVQTLSKSARELLDDTNRRADTSARADASAASAQGAGAARPPDADPQSVAGAGSKAADADPAPPVASSPKLSGTDGPSATPGDDPDDRNDQESAERDEPAESAAAAKTDAASPPVSRMSPKAAAPSDETARTAGKRATTKSAPLPATRPSVPVTTARTPPNRSPAAPPRTAATIVASRSNAGSRIDTHAGRARGDLADGVAGDDGANPGHRARSAAGPIGVRCIRAHTRGAIRANGRAVELRGRSGSTSSTGARVRGTRVQAGEADTARTRCG